MVKRKYSDCTNLFGGFSGKGTTILKPQLLNLVMETRVFVFNKMGVTAQTDRIFKDVATELVSWKTRFFARLCLLAGQFHTSRS